MFPLRKGKFLRALTDRNSAEDIERSSMDPTVVFYVIVGTFLVIEIQVMLIVAILWKRDNQMVDVEHTLDEHTHILTQGG